jgi:hypothetical protein
VSRLDEQKAKSTSNKYLDSETEDWIEDTVENLLELYDRAGTPVKGGAPIAHALRLAYRRGAGLNPHTD